MNIEMNAMFFSGKRPVTSFFARRRVGKYKNRSFDLLGGSYEAGCRAWLPICQWFSLSQQNEMDSFIRDR